MTRRPAPSPRKLRFLITAGPTREYLDPVRYLSNESSGRMGLAVASAALAAGHHVTLICGPIALRPPARAKFVSVVSAAEMAEACARAWPQTDVLIMAAAVADYTPAVRRPEKIKKSAAALTLRLAPTQDVLRTLASRRRRGQIVIGFALESHDGRAHAEQKLASKGLDAIVLNRPDALSAASSATELLVRGEAWRPFARSPKATTARRIVKTAERLANRACETAQNPT